MLTRRKPKLTRKKPYYYNTNRETGATLARSQVRAKNQEETVLAFFRANPKKRFTRVQVNDKALPGKMYTSVQRCISNLTSKGFLRKNNLTQICPSTGKKVHTWKLI